MASYINSPCMGCENRCVKCHSTCEAYKEYKDKNNKINAKVKREEALERMEKDRIRYVKEAVRKYKNLRKWRKY